MAGFIKRITEHCYTQNIKSRGLEKILLCFSHFKYMGASAHLGCGHLNPRVHIGRIYTKHHMILNINTVGLMASENIFSYISY